MLDFNRELGMSFLDPRHLQGKVVAYKLVFDDQNVREELNLMFYVSLYH